MKFAQLAWFVGALGMLPGCSGTYIVGAGAGGSAGAGGGAVAGTPGSDSAGGAAAGTPSIGDSVGGSAGSPSGSAGTPSATGDAGPAEPAGYCGLALPTAPSVVELAPPAEVYRRVESFVLNGASAPTNLPPVTTREWAGNLALGLLDSLNVPSAPGMDRFVKGWLPGTPMPQFWASFFSSRRGTLGDLLTTRLVESAGAGVLTDPAVLTHDGISQRGAVISQRLLCQPVPPPPPGIALPPPAPAGVTRRQQLETETSSPTCNACHRVMDPLGDALEHFTADGSYRNQDNGAPVNSAASFTLPQTGLIAFANVAALAAQLKGSCEVATCLTRQLLTDARNSALLPGELNEQDIASIAMNSSATGGDLREWLRAIVESDTFLRAR